MLLLLLAAPAAARSGVTTGKVLQSGKRLILEVQGHEAWFRLRPETPRLDLPKGLEATVRWTEAGGSGKRVLDSLEARGSVTGKVVSLEKDVLRLERRAGPDLYFRLRWTQTLTGWAPDPWQTALVEDLRPGDAVSVEYSFDDALRLEALRRESP